MRSILRREDPLEVISVEEAGRAVQLTIESSGYTRAELLEQAKAGKFASERARLVWAAVSDVPEEE